MKQSYLVKEAAKNTLGFETLTPLIFRDKVYTP